MATQGLTFRDLRNAILFAALVYLVLSFIRYIVDVVLIFSITALIVVTLSPIVTWLSKHRIPRWAGTAIVVLVFLGALALLIYFIAPAVTAQLRDLGGQLPTLVASVRDWLAGISQRYPFLSGLVPELDLATIERFTRPLAGGVAQITTGTFTFLGAVVIIFISTIYILANPQPIVDGFLNAVDPRHRPRVLAAADRLSVQIWAWAKGTLVAIIGVFTLTWIALSLIGIEQALLFAVIAGLLEIVPILGPILAAVPPTLVALIISPVTALWVVGAFVVIQQIESHVMVPLIMAHQVRLHPVTVVFWVLVMGGLYGLIGIFLATPTAIVAGVLYDELYICEYRKRCGEIPSRTAEERDKEPEGGESGEEQQI